MACQTVNTTHAYLDLGTRAIHDHNSRGGHHGNTMSLPNGPPHPSSQVQGNDFPQIARNVIGIVAANEEDVIYDDVVTKT